MPSTSAGPMPAEAAVSLPAWLIEAGRFGLDECRLVLVPARRGIDALALIGWSADAHPPLLCALLRSWEARFGAQLVALFDRELHVSVARPPAEAEHPNSRGPVHGTAAWRGLVAGAPPLAWRTTTHFPSRAGPR
ncbi:DUF4253 domain-containing protein [Streptomyces sp. NPDC001817]|uniref:DUF4253 domain-containing protein n=1 Tax=Streptomyces sp. NPDC001817 TaxID=3154398 RepID=UPI0033207CC6